MFDYSDFLSKRISAVSVISIFMAVASAANAASPGTSDHSFNPAIGLILNGTYGQFSQDPQDYSISGFPAGAESEPGARGFSLGESELNISANIDPDWYGILTTAMASEEVSVENAYVQSTSLGQGFTLRGGRFFSGVGYLNEQHAHTWSFSDTALVYRALLGNQYADDGLQLRWLIPIDLFTEVGAEWFNGNSFPAGGSANKGRGSWSGFIHVGGDYNTSNSWRAGLSYLSTKAADRESGTADNPDLFSGSSKIAIADFVWKWAPNGNPYSQSFTFQTEYLQSRNKGDFTPADGIALPYDATPSGWYAQAIYQFMPRWRVGLRHDQLRADQPGTAFTTTALDDQNHNPRRATVMIDFAGSEFSRLRLQYNHDQSQPDSQDQWFIQYTMSLGAHGAHIF